ncbi:unnamed protein product [Lactuca saligna]|uniref:MULE transposase domain-containing protein n=1 Tax=Lactuca saligna TaxID=75948 RepID=A0AA35ZH08_LACSI|nr:unnamed protein product [Lactuca saligna]
MSPTHSKVRITEITEPPPYSKRLFLEWHNIPAVDLEDGMDHTEKESGNDSTPTSHMEKDLGNDATFTDHMEKDLGNDATLTNHMENDLGNDATLTDHMENDLVNDANDFDFEMNIDKDVEWVGGSSNTVVDEGTHDEALEVINTDFLASDSSSNEGINGQRKKSIRAIQRAHENDEALVSEPFYIFQKFGSAKEFKDKVKLHAIKTRRELALEKNDKNRVRWVCKGTIPKLGPNVEVNDEEEICPWVLLASKWKKYVNWTVKTYNKVHKCLQTRTVKASGKRDFLGFDGAFMKGPFPGQILSAVAVVETENISSWTWFLSCLGEDLGLNTNSNFTFITDRKKGILNAIATLFPCAENCYCVRHIRDNMRKQWRGKPFEDLLWTCATATHVQQFNKAMEELKKLNKDCYEWLKKIPPQHWSRFHFAGRPKKKRKKAAYEIDDMVKGNSASRILQSVTCSKYNNIGHNARSCKGQKASAPSVPSGSGGPGGSGKGKGKVG